MAEFWIQFGIAAGVTFLLTALLGRIIIPILRGKKVGQKILDIGPNWHKSKEGTPTMGGVCFILAILLCLCGFAVFYLLRKGQERLIPLALTLALAVMNGLIGFVDDFCKLMKKQNQGLKLS